jgi:hypothetical protein
MRELRPKVRRKRYKAAGGRLRYWAEVHNARGLLRGEGTFGSHAEAMARAWAMIAEIEQRETPPTAA